MTVLVGILCSDGVVIASDSAATFGTGQMLTIGQQSTRKVYKLSDNMIYASTGAVGVGQLIADRLASGWKSGDFKGANSPEALMNKFGMAIHNLVVPYLQSGQHVHQLVGNASGSLCKSLMAFEFKGTPCLCSFDFNGVPERATPQLPFVSLGSGQAIADPFLAFLKRLIWSSSQPTVAEGKLVSVWTIDHVSKTNPGGVGGAIQLMVLTGKPEILEISGPESDEHKQQAAGAEQAMLKFLRPEPSTGAAPPMPNPPAA